MAIKNIIDSLSGYTPDSENLSLMLDFLERYFSPIHTSVIAQILLLLSIIPIIWLAASKKNNRRKQDFLCFIILFSAYISYILLRAFIQLPTLSFPTFATFISICITIYLIINHKTGNIIFQDAIYSLIIISSFLFIFLIPSNQLSLRLNSINYSAGSLILTMIFLKAMEIILRLSVYDAGIFFTLNNLTIDELKENKRAVTTFFLIFIALINFMMQYDAITNYIIPTYGNTMYQLSFSHYINVHGYRTPIALEYGGTGNNYYVPGFRYFISVISLLTDTDVIPAANLFMIIISIISPFTFYILSYKLTQSYLAGIISAFISLASPELQIYMVRPLPEMLGLVFILFSLYFALEFIKNRKARKLPELINKKIKNKKSLLKKLVENFLSFLSNNRPNYLFAAILTSVTVCYLHPQSQTALTFTYGFISFIYLNIFISRLLFIRYELKQPFFMTLRMLFIALLVGGLYLHWHYLQTSTLYPKVLAPYKYKEFSKILGFKDYFIIGELVLSLAIIGLYFAYIDRIKIEVESKILIFCWVIATLILTKNEILGIKAHTERFLAFLAESAVIAASIGLWYLAGFICEIGEIFD